VEKLQLKRKPGIVNGNLTLPRSKSISNRLLIIQALAASETKLNKLSTANDTILLMRNLKGIHTCASSRIPMVVDAGNAGTVFRFLTALLAITKGTWLLTGDSRMKKRPIKDLVEALSDLGADINYAGNENYPPLHIKGTELSENIVKVDPSKSSQFISALMLIAPCLKNGLKIKLKSKAVSEPYIKMTSQLMNQCGVQVEMKNDMISVKPGEYRIEETKIEPDWSSASYWFEIAAICEGAEVFLNDFHKNSVQGDRVCVELFSRLGVKTTFEKGGIQLKNSTLFEKSFEYDFSDHPDLVPAVMVTCAAKNIPAVFNGVGHLKYKESDRIKSLETELAKIGAVLEKTKKGIRLIPGGRNLSAGELEFNTYDDHRIAMSLAPLVAVIDKIIINDPGVVVKSYPSFWEDIERSGLAMVEKN